MNEVFRFVLGRAAGRDPLDRVEWTSVVAYPTRLSARAQAWLALDTVAAQDITRRFVSSDPSFARSIRAVWRQLGGLDDWVLTHRRPTAAAFRTAAEAELGRTLGELLVDPRLEEVRNRFADSLLAVALSRRMGTATAHLSRGLRLLAAVERLGRGASAAVVLKALEAPIRLPRRRMPRTDVPIPGSGGPGTTSPADAAERYLDLGRDLLGLTQYAAARAPQFEQAEAFELGTHVRYRTSGVTLDDLSFLSETGRTRISQQLGTQGLRLADVRRVLDQAQAELARLPSLGQLLSSDEVTVPTTTGIARIVGVSDLLVVRETHIRYEPGELSHIENVLPHERFSREFRRATSLESFEEVETTEAERSDRELQSTSRSEVRSEVQRTLEERLKFGADAEITVRGPSVESTVGADFAYERSTEEASEAASSFAREVVDQAASTIEQSTVQRRSTRRTAKTEDTASRGIDNESAEPVVGLYRWVDRYVGFEVLNYDRRMLVECMVPEPAAFFRFAARGRVPRGVIAREPAPLVASIVGMPADTDTTGTVPLRPEHLTEHTYGAWVARYGVSSVQPPPAGSTTVGFAAGLDQALPEDNANDSRAKVLESGAISIPGGYSASDWEIAVSRDYDHAADSDGEHGHYVITVGTSQIGPRAAGAIADSRPLPAPSGPLVGNVPVTLLAENYENLSFTIMIDCFRLPETLRAWQLETYGLIVNEYRRQLAEYQDQLASAQIQDDISGGAGTHPLTLQSFARTEVKRGAIMAITGQSFDEFDAVRQTDAGAPTELALADAEAEGRYVQFVEQAFEWSALSYALYPYFWGRKLEWTGVAFQDHVDESFARFLRAGSARVVVPVRPGFEAAVRHFLDEGVPWLDGEPPILEDERSDDEAPPYIYIHEELKEQLGVDYRPADGVLRATTSSETVDWSDADPTLNWRGRKVRFAGSTYRVMEVDPSRRTARLDRPFEGATGSYPYEVGPRVVGEPWETRFPTTLVVLDGEGGPLPRIEIAD